MTILYRGNERGEILDAAGQVIGRVVPPEPVAWASPNVIPLTGMRDNFPCILTPFKCEANTVPLLSAATLDLTAAAVRVPDEVAAAVRRCAEIAGQKETEYRRQYKGTPGPDGIRRGGDYDPHTDGMSDGACAVENAIMAEFPEAFE